VGGPKGEGAILSGKRTPRRTPRRGIDRHLAAVLYWGPWIGSYFGFGTCRALAWLRLPDVWVGLGSGFGKW
jgi:hypothetical protein